MDKIRVEEGLASNKGECNWCGVEFEEDGMPTLPRYVVTVVHFDGFTLRLCSSHYREMLGAWVRLFVDEFFPTQ